MVDTDSIYIYSHFGSIIEQEGICSYIRMVLEGRNSIKPALITGISGYNGTYLAKYPI